MDLERVLVLCTDMEGFDDEAYELWRKLPYPKVLFSAKKRDDPSAVFFREYQNLNSVPDLIPARKFYKDGKVLKTVNGMI